MCPKWMAVLVVAAAGCSPDAGSKAKATPRRETSLPPPCHPGCFPAGTPVATPAGPRRVEDIGPGDLVILVGSDGAPVSGPVHSTFRTDNRLVEVRTESGSLVTTETQPLCLCEGGFRPAGELAAGDVIWRWEDGRRRAARVLAVTPTGREAPVFNLVVGESAVFVAGGFLARGKPPALPSSLSATTR